MIEGAAAGSTAQLCQAPQGRHGWTHSSEPSLVTGDTVVTDSGPDEDDDLWDIGAKEYLHLIMFSKK